MKPVSSDDKPAESAEKSGERGGQEAGGGKEEEEKEAGSQGGEDGGRGRGQEGGGRNPTARMINLPGLQRNQVRRWETRGRGKGSEEWGIRGALEV